MIYLDASLVVALLVEERASHEVDVWLRACGDTELAVSRWVTVEIASALGKRVRMQTITEAGRSAAWSAYSGLLEDRLTLVVIPDEAFDRAAMMLRPYELGLRGGDALHLAIASLANRSIATLDDRMAAAAVRYGITVEPVFQ